MSAILRVLVVCACRVDVMRPRKYAKPTQKHLQYPQHALCHPAEIFNPVPRQSPINGPISVRAGEQEDRGERELDKGHYLESSTKVKAAQKWVKARRGGEPLIRSQSQVASMLAYVRCQLLAGPER